MHHHHGLKGVVILDHSLSIWYHLTGWRGFWEGESLELFLAGSPGVGGREHRGRKTLEALEPVWLVAGAMGSKGTEESRKSLKGGWVLNYIHLPCSNLAGERGGKDRNKHISKVCR